MMDYRSVLAATLLLLQAGISSAQTNPGKPTAAAGNSRALPPGSNKAIKSGRPNISGPQPRDGSPSISLLGSVVTASPAESFALNGNLAYVCDNNEISVIDITNPQSPQVVATAASGLFANSALTYCGMLRGTLSVFSDQADTGNGDTPGYSAFDLTNPQQPTLIASTQINKRFFGGATYIGNLAFVPTEAGIFVGGFWVGSDGDLLAFDLSNFSNPVLLGTLETPQVDPTYGGPTPVNGETEASPTLIYLGGATSSGGYNNGVGRLQVVDVSDPANMQVVTQLAIPGALLFYAPQIVGNVAVGIGNTGGFVGSYNANPGAFGNIVVATFDVTDLRAPTILSITTATNYSVGLGGGVAQIGPAQFAYAGVQDSSGNSVLLIVDVTNPTAPVLSSYPIQQPINSMQAVGTTLYATLGSGGFAAYSIPGAGNSSSPFVCPVSVDAMIVVDRGANIPPQATLQAKAALDLFINSLQLSPDQVGVISFTNVATVNQPLTTQGSQALSAINNIVPGGSSYIGAGIQAAQAQLTGPLHNPTATPLMIVVSDGADLAAPNSGATLAAAAAAKAAGIEIISMQYGSSPSTLMQSIASSASTYYLVSP
jgi:hypothetical protein